MSTESNNRPDPRDYFEVSDAQNARYQSPSLPLQSQIGPTAGAIQIPADELESLTDYASWANNPPFESPGRSGYVKRKSPLKVGETSVHGYKLKGVGTFSQKTRTISPPKGDSYQQMFGTIDSGGNILDEVPVILIHMGIAENGTLYPVLDPPKPEGGLSSGRGQREFQNAAKLHKGGVSACLPIAWGCYPEIKWQNEPTEFVILGIPSDVPERLGAYFEPDTSSGRFEVGKGMKALIERRFEVVDTRQRKLGEPMLKITADIGKNIGRLLRSAHEAGVARFASHLGNFSLMPNKRDLLLHDLDSSVEIDSLPPQAKALTMTRDIESAIFGFTHSITHSNAYWIINDLGRFEKLNPFKALLKGYFQEEVDATSINEASQRILDMVVQLIKIRGERPSIDAQRMWMPYAMLNLVPLCLNEVFKLYEKSALNQRNKLPYGLEEFNANWQRFSRQQEIMYIRASESLTAKHRR
ncbi:MAG: hypothetical protein Q8P62_03920 [Candidatus Peregrinibacteria bacterium]|nr:hypothetical protein [Candidatus Peregrinibacteria bacterium]